MPSILMITSPTRIPALKAGPSLDIRVTIIPSSTGRPRAQAVDRQGKLLQDFSIAETENAIHVLNAPSPGATSSLSISRYIVDMAQKSFELAA